MTEKLEHMTRDVLIKDMSGASAFSAVADCVANDGWVKAEFEVSYR